MKSFLFSSLSLGMTTETFLGFADLFVRFPSSGWLFLYLLLSPPPSLGLLARAQAAAHLWKRNE